VSPRGRIARAAVAVVAAGAAAAPAGAAPPAARRAAAWVQGALGGAPAGQRADAIVGLAAAGRSRADLAPLLARLARQAPAYGRSAGAAAKVALAAAAAGGDPHRLGGVDYVARVRATYAAGRFGSTAFDQALSMLALAGAGDRVPPGAVSALRAGQSAGGWGFELRTSLADDCQSTALVVEALSAAGLRPGDPMVRRALAWLAGRRNADGGYSFSCAPGAPTEADTTAFVVRAFLSAGRRPPAGTAAALLRLQRPDGSVAFTATSAGSPLIATLDALPALAGVPLPPPPAR
jgi:hypothetical protein